MDRLQRATILTRLIKRLREEESWCGETHVQKAALFLQDLMKVPLGFAFILYKHGPFSFPLRAELNGLRADDLIRLEPQRLYGPRIQPTELSDYLQRTYSRTLAEYAERINFVATKFGRKRVGDLERLATAFYLTERPGAEQSVLGRAMRLTEIKPHIALPDAEAAVEEIDHVIEEARAYVP